MSEEPCRISIAGTPAPADLLDRIQKQAASREGPVLLAETHPEASALSLREQVNEAAYRDRFQELLRSRYILRLNTPSPTGPKLWRLLQRIYHKLFSFQHAQIAAEQSQINEVLIMGRDFDREDNAQRIAALEARIAELETGRS